VDSCGDDGAGERTAVHLATHAATLIGLVLEPGYVTAPMSSSDAKGVDPALRDIGGPLVPIDGEAAAHLAQVAALHGNRQVVGFALPRVEAGGEVERGWELGEVQGARFGPGQRHAGVVGQELHVRARSKTRAATPRIIVSVKSPTGR
jgi:hypothetical protein